MKLGVVGGGPGGLFLARLVRRFDPGIEIDVLEQNPARATFGFGVVLAGQAQDRLNAEDPELMARLSEHMVLVDQQDFTLQHATQNVRYAGQSGAIERLKMLEVLEDLCATVGIQVQHETRITSKEQLASYDLVVGADGANSIVRRLWEEDYRPISRPATNRFAWYGVDRALNPSSLVFRCIEGGVCIAHYYPYTSERSTFVAECDAGAWNAGGLSSMSDDERRAFFETVFASELSGGKLLSNKSIWRKFDAISCQNWSAGHTVLLGDALRIAHFSIGSGTRLAMEDALALFEALKAHPGDVPAIQADYEARRKRVRDLFTAATLASIDWYDDVAGVMDADVMDFVYGFMQRTGRMDDKRLKMFAPEFFAAYQAHLSKGV